MLSRKITIQKSFRIEANMENDLELLSQKLNRPQNELVNAALNSLMLDNMEWFVEDYLIDLCKDFLDKKVSELSIEITGLKIHLHDDGKAIYFNYNIEKPTFFKESSEGTTSNNSIGYDLISNMLSDIALKIGSDAPEIEDYLHKRFEYIFARESIIQKFNRDTFIKESAGISE